jgi:ABC-type Fe3+/spermidine/putrescine transport system ATPase subunit
MTTGGDWVLAAGVDLQVAAGRDRGLLGPSGSGKSTLLKIIAGLEPPDAGSVWFDAGDISGLPPERRGFALMFQDFALFPHLDVQDNVAFGLVEQGQCRKAQARAQALRMLARVRAGRPCQHAGVERYPAASSSAWRWRVPSITRRASCCWTSRSRRWTPSCAGSCATSLEAAFAAAGMATLLVTHDEAEARVMADRAVRLVQGGLQSVC